MFFFSRLKKSRRPWMKRGLKRPWSCGAGIIHACQDWSHRSIKNCDLNPDICFCPDASRQTPERFFSINTATASLFFSHVFFDYSKCPVCLQELRKQPEDVQTPGSSQTGVWTASCKSSPDAVTFTLCWQSWPGSREYCTNSSLPWYTCCLQVKWSNQRGWHFECFIRPPKGLPANNDSAAAVWMQCAAAISGWTRLNNCKHTVCVVLHSDPIQTLSWYLSRKVKSDEKSFVCHCWPTLFVWSPGYQMTPGSCWGMTCLALPARRSSHCGSVRCETQWKPSCEAHLRLWLSLFLW